MILPESTPQGVNTERTHFTNQWLHNYALLTEREVKIARYYEFYFLRFLCAFPVMHHRCQSEKGLPKTHLKVKYRNALYKSLALIWKCFRSAKLDQYAKTWALVDWL